MSLFAVTQAHIPVTHHSCSSITPLRVTPSLSHTHFIHSLILSPCKASQASSPAHVGAQPCCSHVVGRRPPRREADGTAWTRALRLPSTICSRVVGGNHKSSCSGMWGRRTLPPTLPLHLSRVSHSTSTADAVVCVLMSL